MNILILSSVQQMLPRCVNDRTGRVGTLTHTHRANTPVTNPPTDHCRPAPPPPSVQLSVFLSLPVSAILLSIICPSACCFSSVLSSHCPRPRQLKINSTPDLSASSLASDGQYLAILNTLSNISLTNRNTHTHTLLSQRHKCGSSWRPAWSEQGGADRGRPRF